MSDIGRVPVLSALELAARRLVDARSRETGLVHSETLPEALQGVPESEKALVLAVLEGASEIAADPIGPNREEIYAFLDTRLDKVRQADVNEDWQLSDSELGQLTKVGDLAAQMAKTLKAQDPVPAAEAHVFSGLEGEPLKAKLRELSAAHTELGYGYARAVLFSNLSNVKGEVAGLYTDASLETTSTPREGPGPVMNTEHVWPKSRGVRDTPALSDLHHLFPADSYTNGRRASHPFGEVLVPKWSKDGSALGENKDGELRFHPRPGARGPLARALMYVHTMYELPFPEGEAALVQKWNLEEPPTPEEVARNDEVSRHQGNRNPFVDHPDLVQRALQIP